MGDKSLYPIIRLEFIKTKQKKKHMLSIGDEWLPTNSQPKLVTSSCNSFDLDI
jgi:hypothetical protein